MESIRIDVKAIVQPVRPNALGLNVNFVADHAAMRSKGQGYTQALKSMGARSLRYPGGEKSNEFLWSAPPWTAPAPRLGLRGPAARLFVEGAPVSAAGEFLVEPMDFDQFISICREVGAQPMVCVNLGSAYVKDEPGRLVGTPRERLLENAVEWVRYANKVKGYGVRDWEIGNESYWRGSVATLKAEDYARDVREFSRAMKAVDPSIHIGANGHVEKDYVSTAEAPGGPIWWEQLLKACSADIDFIVVHPYPCFEWGSYAHFQGHSPCLTDAVEQAAAALAQWAPAQDAARIRIQATETNAFDWAASKWYQGNKGGWAWANDLGHAIVLFELLGQHIAHPRVDGVQVWTSRWFSSPSRLEDVLGDDNELLPTGQAMGLWGRHLRSRLLAIPGHGIGPMYATRDEDPDSLCLLLVNKQADDRELQLDLGGTAAWDAAWECFTGASPQDEHPTVRSLPGFALPGGKVSLRLPALSINALELRRRHA